MNLMWSNSDVWDGIKGSFFGDGKEMEFEGVYIVVSGNAELMLMFFFSALFIYVF